MRPYINGIELYEIKHIENISFFRAAVAGFLFTICYYYIPASLSLCLEVFICNSGTEGHSIRVAGIAYEIGREPGLSNPELDLLYQAGLVHDLGKIGIPDVILKKEEHMKDDEYLIIRNHSTIGETILQEVGQFMPIIAGMTR